MRCIKFLILISLLLIPSICFGADDMLVTPAGAGNKDGTTWGNAMSITEFATDWASASIAGDRYFLAGGTYTFTGHISTNARDGTALAPVQVIGVKSGTTNDPPNIDDWAFGDDRPVLTQGAYLFQYDMWASFRNLRGTGSLSTALIKGDDGTSMYNIKAIYTGTGAALDTDYGSIVYCEISAANGRGTRGANDTNFYFNYIYDVSTEGIYSGVSGGIVGNIFDNCGTGIWINGNTASGGIANNTFYSCTIGIDLNTSPVISIVNNIFDACGTGVISDSAYPNAIVDYNCWDNTQDTVNVTWGTNRVEGDPGLNDPGSNDFTLGSGSNCLDAGMDVGKNGAPGNFLVNIGADQDDNAAAGGGGGSAGHVLVY